MKNIKNLERIERYVNQEMDAQENFEFEKELQFNSELQNDLDQYNSLIKGIKLFSWKQKAKKSYQQYKQFKVLKAIGIASIILAMGALSYFAINQTLDTHKVETPESEEEVSADWNIPKEVFTISTQSETVIECLVLKWVYTNSKLKNGLFEEWISIRTNV